MFLLKFPLLVILDDTCLIPATLGDGCFLPPAYEVRGKVLFSQVSVCLLTFQGGGYPIPGLDGGWGGTPSQVWMVGGGGIPGLDGGGYPRSWWLGRVLQVWMVGGVPRVPPMARSGWWGGGYPRSGWWVVTSGLDGRRYPGYPPPPLDRTA